MAYRFVYPINLEYTAESRFEAVNYKFVVDKIAELEETLDGKYALVDHTHDYSTVYSAINHTHDYSDVYAAIDHTHDYSDVYATINHTHDYSNTYAAIDHTHSGYALTDHNHDTSYSAINHSHDGTYATVNHNHDTTYSAIGHNHNSEYASINHNHDTAYSAIGHTHNQFLVTTIDTLSGGTITLDRTKAMYKKEITASTTFVFDTSNLTIANNEVMTFELVMVMGSTAFNITYPSTVTWLEGSVPVTTLPNKTYLLAFRSYDGGTSWIGSYQGKF